MSRPKTKHGNQKRHDRPERRMSQPRKTLAGRRKQARKIAESVLEETVERLESTGVNLESIDPGLMTLTRAAEILGVKHDMLWTHVRSGRLKRVPVDCPRGRTVVIVRKTDLREWRDDQVKRNTEIGTEAARQRNEKLLAAEI